MDTKELRALLAQATPGPWEAQYEFNLKGEGGRSVGTFGGYQNNQVCAKKLYHESVANRNLTVAAVNALPRLLDVVEAAEHLIDANDWKSGRPHALDGLRATVAKWREG